MSAFDEGIISKNFDEGMSYKSIDCSLVKIFANILEDFWLIETAVVCKGFGSICTVSV